MKMNIGDCNCYFNNIIYKILNVKQFKILLQSQLNKTLRFDTIGKYCNNY